MRSSSRGGDAGAEDVQEHSGESGIHESGVRDEMLFRPHVHTSSPRITNIKPIFPMPVILPRLPCVHVSGGGAACNPSLAVT